MSSSVVVKSVTTPWPVLVIVSDCVYVSLSTLLERSSKDKDERIVMFVAQLNERLHGGEDGQ